MSCGYKVPEGSMHPEGPNRWAPEGSGPLTAEKIAEARALCEAVGPLSFFDWTGRPYGTVDTSGVFRQNGTFGDGKVSGGGWGAVHDGGFGLSSREDYRFVAAASRWLPRLLDMLSEKVAFTQGEER